MSIQAHCGDLHGRAASRRGFDVIVIGSRTQSPTGQDFPVFYLQFRDGGWSAPVEVGGAGVDSFFGSVWDTVQIASDGEERLFVTWSVRGK